MKQSERQSADRLRRTSEYIRAAESFARYAHKEWVEGSADERALMICCVDTTVPDGTGLMCVASGDRDLMAAAVMHMMQDKDLGSVLHKARVVSQASGDMGEEIRNVRRRLRTLYIQAAAVALWVLLLVGMQLWIGGSWLMTVSSLLMMAFLGLLVGHEITERRRRLARLVRADRSDRKERAQHQARSFLEEMARRMETDDEDED